MGEGAEGEGRAGAAGGGDARRSASRADRSWPVNSSTTFCKTKRNLHLNTTNRYNPQTIDIVTGLMNYKFNYFIRLFYINQHASYRQTVIITTPDKLNCSNEDRCTRLTYRTEC